MIKVNLFPGKTHCYGKWVLISLTKKEKEHESTT